MGDTKGFVKQWPNDQPTPSPAPRRFRVFVPDGYPHHNNMVASHVYGCYFPISNITFTEAGMPTRGKPEGVEWIDAEG